MLTLNFRSLQISWPVCLAFRSFCLAQRLTIDGAFTSITFIFIDAISYFERLEDFCRSEFAGVTFAFPLAHSLPVAFPRAANELRGDRLHVSVHAGGRWGCSRRGRLAVTSQSPQIQLSQLPQEGVPLLLAELRPELQDVSLSRTFQSLLRFSKGQHSVWTDDDQRWCLKNTQLCCGRSLCFKEAFSWSEWWSHRYGTSKRPELVRIQIKYDWIKSEQCWKIMTKKVSEIKGFSFFVKWFKFFKYKKNSSW